MAQALDALRFSEYFEVDPVDLDDYGAYDVSLDRDDRLLIDPKLLDDSAVPEMEGAYSDIHDRFTLIMRLLVRSRSENDAIWRAALSRFRFPEFRAAGLGYARFSTSGRGWRSEETARTLRTAKEIIEAGIADPIIFELAGLLEEGIGADHISDMFGNLLAPRLARFTRRVCRDLGIPTSEQPLAGARYRLPVFENDGRTRPIVLVPEDVLSRLPLAMDRDEIADVVAENERLRGYVNSRIGTAWLRETRRSRAFANEVFRDPKVLRQLIPLYKEARPKRYDFVSDPARHERLEAVVAKELGDALEIDIDENPTADDVFNVVGAIIDDFKQKIENNHLRTALFVDDKPRPENVLQAVFQMAAQIHCDYNDLDLSPETNAGNGAVDFKFSHGSRRKVVVELKLAANPKLVAGYQKQIEAYEKAERTPYSYYVVLDDGKHSQKILRLQEIADEDGEYDESPELIVIDGRRRQSASRL
jgi:hypothetical protein